MGHLPLSFLHRLGAIFTMSEILNYLKVGLGVVLLFGAAIFLHELGHFLVARWRGLKVEGFAVGFGPKIFAWTRDGIEYSVRWIPAGGYVKLPQMITSSAIEGEGAKDIPPAPPFSKILVAMAGPAMNVLFAFAIATLIWRVGLPVPVNPAIIGYMDPLSEEAKAGIHEKDKIVAVDGKPVKSWEEVCSITFLALTNVLPVAIEQNGKTNTYHLKAEAGTLPDLKMLHLNPLDYLVIGSVNPGSAAEKANIQPGDQILEFAGVPITSSHELTNLVQKFGGQTASMVVLRSNQRLTLHVIPAVDPATKISRMGVVFGPGKDHYEVEYPTPWAQVTGVVANVKGTLSALLHSRSSGVKAKDLSGPVGIISALAVQVNTDYRLALSFLVLLNINLAIINMLPIPVLDGGHILMAVIEWIRRRPLELRLVEYITTGFAVLLVSFMLYVTCYDIKRLPLIRTLFNRDTQIEPGEKSGATPASHDQPETIPAQSAPAR
jgi:regulator of sigma E protease